MCLLSPGHKPAVRPSVHWARCVSHIINGSVHIETSTAISTLHSASQPVARDNTRHHRDQHWIYLFIFAFFSSSFVESTKDNPVFCYQHNDYHRRCDRKRWQTHSIFFDCCSTVCHTSAVDWAEIKKKKIFQPCRFTDTYSNISSAIFPILRANIARAPNQLIRQLIEQQQRRRRRRQHQHENDLVCLDRPPLTHIWFIYAKRTCSNQIDYSMPANCIHQHQHHSNNV